MKSNDKVNWIKHMTFMKDSGHFVGSELKKMHIKIIHKY